MKMENMHTSTKTAYITIKTVQVYTLTLLEVVSHILSHYKCLYSTNRKWHYADI